MKLSLNWLKDHIDFKETPEKLAELLTLSGSEVEKIEYLKKKMSDKIVVGKILEIKKHPQADKLHLVKVDIGSKRLEVVCGAPNVKLGQKVVVALEGTRLANGVILKKTTIRGIESQGMICAEDELGLGEEHQGIVVLDSQAKVGQKAAKYLGLDDVVFDLDITPNRADCFSVIGLAREVQALTSKKRREMKFEFQEDKEQKIDNLLKVNVLDRKLCPQYMARMVRDIEVKESPQWLKNRLMASGVKPVNNVVDITNYVMLEAGQPLHAFDWRKLEGGKNKEKKEIIVRRAKRGEKIKTLDDKIRQLDLEMLVIADAKKAIAVAGAMGGKKTEVSSQTKEIIIESAIFNPVSIRKTSQRLGLRSESSTRFEKGLDWEMAAEALDRATYWMAKLGHGKVVSGRLALETKRKVKNQVTLSLNYLNDLLGVKIDLSEVIRILKDLGFKIARKSGSQIKVIIPSWRSDVSLPADLVEEIGRIYDYNKMTPTFLRGELKPPVFNSRLYWEKVIKETLVGVGFEEVYNYSFYSQDLLTKAYIPFKGHLKVLNPLNPDQDYLRVSLFPRLLENVAYNLHFFEEFRIFEIGKVYLENKSQKLPQERWVVAGALVLKDNQGFYQAKGALETILEKLNIREIQFEKGSPERIFNPKKKAQIRTVQKEIGVLGEVDRRVLNNFKLKEKIVLFELDLEELMARATLKPEYQALPAFPAMERDLALIIDKRIPYKEIQQAIQKIDKLIQKVELFDVYEAKEFGPNKRSLAFHIVFQSDKRTLKAQEVDKIQEKIIKKLENLFKAQIRR